LNVSGYFDLIVKLWSGPSGNRIEWRPGITGGVFYGYANIKYKRFSGDGPGVETVESAPGMRIMGPTLGTQQRLTYTDKNDRMTYGLGVTGSLGKMKYQVLDGTATHSLHYLTAFGTLGIQIRRNPTKRAEVQ
jgi:hypothetical protein